MNNHNGIPTNFSNPTSSNNNSNMNNINPYTRHQSLKTNNYPQQQYMNSDQYSMPKINANQNYPAYNYLQNQQSYQPYQPNQYSQPHQQGIPLNSYNRQKTTPAPYTTPNMGYQPMNTGFNVYQLAKQIIMNYADNIFLKHDRNRSGYLDVNEMYTCIAELYTSQGKPAPSFQDVLVIMAKFDEDRNGLIDIDEFRKLLLILSGNM